MPTAPGIDNPNIAALTPGTRPCGLTAALLRKALENANDVVSVIVSGHVAGSGMLDTLASVLGQDYRHIEILLVVEVDASVEIEDSRVRVIHFATDTTTAWNAGIHASTGDFLLFLTSGDKLAPDAVALLVYAMLRQPAAAFAYPFRCAFAHAEATWNTLPFNSYDLLWSNHSVGCTLVRRSAITPEQPEPIAGCQDWGLWLRLCANGHLGVRAPAQSGESSYHQSAIQALLCPHELQHILIQNASLYSPAAITASKRTWRPALSVIVPFYNGHRFIRETLQSLKDQTTDDFELIVVNDGSTHPRSLKALAALRTDPWTRVLDCEHRGLPSARNAGALAARSELIMFLDADDLLDRGAIEKLCWYIAIHPESAFVYSGVTHFGDSYGTSFEEFDPDRLHRENYLTATCIMRRRVFMELGGNDPCLIETWEDYEYWLRLVDQGYSGKLFPEALFLYRRHPGGNSKALRRRAGNDGASLSPDLLARHGLRCRYGRQPMRVHSLEQDPLSEGTTICSVRSYRRPNLPNLFSEKRWETDKPAVLCLTPELTTDPGSQLVLFHLRHLKYYVVHVICDSPAADRVADLPTCADEVYFLAHMGEGVQQHAFLKYLMIAKAIDIVIHQNVMPAHDLATRWASCSTEVRFMNWPAPPDGASSKDIREQLQRELKPLLNSVDRERRLLDYQKEIIARPVLG